MAQDKRGVQGGGFEEEHLYDYADELEVIGNIHDNPELMEVQMLTDEHKEKIKYLSQLKYIDRGIDRKISEMDKWKCRATNITTILSGMPRGNTIDKISDCVANIADLNTEIDREIDKLVDIRKEIKCKINAIEDDRLRNILIDRYLYYMTWEEIAYKNFYSWQHVYRLHEKALDLINI